MEGLRRDSSKVDLSSEEWIKKGRATDGEGQFEHYDYDTAENK